MAQKTSNMRLLLTAILVALLCGIVIAPAIAGGVFYYVPAGSGAGNVIASMSLTGSNCSSSQCGFLASTAGTVGTALPTMLSGSFGAGTYALQTSGTDHIGTACNSYSTLSINSSSGAISNTSAAPGQQYPGLCVTATPATSGSAFTQAFTAYGGWFVSTSGSGTTCSFASPCTLAQCQTNMQGNSTNKACYVRSGTYTPASAGNNCSETGVLMILGSSDNGETWSYYPPDGVDSAIINGQASGATGNDMGICINSANNITINGLTIENVQLTGIGGTGTGDIIENNIVHDTTNTTSSTQCIDLNNGNFQILHNYVYNCTGMGIAAFPTTSGGSTGLTIGWNYIYNAASACSDCGGIYLDTSAGGNGVTPASNINIKFNYIHDCGGGGGCNPYYIDDTFSFVTMTGNVFSGKAFDCGFLHGGSNVITTGHICDMTTIVENPFGEQSTGGTPTGDTFTNSLVLASIAGSSAGSGYNCNTSPCALTNGPNGYQNYVGTGINAGGALPDSNPQQQIAPNFTTCGWEYILPSNSPVYNAPVSFPVQPAGWGTAGYWGPPGFTIPQVGNAPSPPHTC